MIDAATSKPALGSLTLRDVGGLAGFLRNPGLAICALRAGPPKGRDSQGNIYFEQPGRPKSNRTRRWVLYAGPPDASTIGPHWHSWLHHMTDQPLPEHDGNAWEKPHKANATGTAAGYRPPGHDYEGGKRAKAAADYEAWSPESSE